MDRIDDKDVDQAAGAEVFNFAKFKEKLEREKPIIKIGAKFVVPDLGGATCFGGDVLPEGFVHAVRGGNYGDRDYEQVTGKIRENKTGRLEKGAEVIVVGFSKEFGVFCRYEGLQADQETGGSALIPGSLFFIEENVLLAWPELIKKQAEKTQRRDEEVARLIEEARKFIDDV